MVHRIVKRLVPSHWVHKRGTRFKRGYGRVDSGNVLCFAAAAFPCRQQPLDLDLQDFQEKQVDAMGKEKNIERRNHHHQAQAGPTRVFTVRRQFEKQSRPSCNAHHGDGITI